MEVYFSDVWGTVCDNGWGWNEADVVCSELGYRSATLFYAAETRTNAYNVSGTIWLDNVSCGGSEFTLIDCQHNSWGTVSCSHRHDIWVQCSVGKYIYTVADPGGGAESAAPPPPFFGRFLLFSGAASNNLDSAPPPPFTDPGSASDIGLIL